MTPGVLDVLFNKMDTIDTEPEHRLISAFLPGDEASKLFTDLASQVTWDTSMKARKTACYGETYDESGVNFVVQEMHPLLISLCDDVYGEVGFRPTNCLLNYYEDGTSTMGYHSDTISNLEEGTGIVIVSKGCYNSSGFQEYILCRLISNLGKKLFKICSQRVGQRLSIVTITR